MPLSLLCTCGLPKIRCVFVLSMALCLGILTVCSATSARELRIEVRETAGIRRFSYPVKAKLELPAETDSRRLRLLYNGKTVPAQFREDRSRQKSSDWWVDFNINLMPYESRILTIDSEGDPSSNASPKRGHKLTVSRDAYQVANEPYISWRIPKDLRGLLRSVHFRPIKHLQPKSTGLMLYDSDGKSHALGNAGLAVDSEVVRQGALAVALRFQSAIREPALSGVKVVVDLYFPVSKSWVEVDWRINDPAGKVRGASASLNLNLDPPTARSPTLVDFGAANLVYLTLRSGQVAELRAGRVSAQHTPPYQWQVRRGTLADPSNLSPYVFGPKASSPKQNLQGWAHVMDRQRCLAIAAAEFGRTGEDRITAFSRGVVRFRRTFSDGLEKPSDENETPRHQKRLRFWLHFVSFPPQISAATSPQAMQNPVAVRVIE